MRLHSIHCLQIKHIVSRSGVEREGGETSICNTGKRIYGFYTRKMQVSSFRNGMYPLTHRTALLESMPCKVYIYTLLHCPPRMKYLRVATWRTWDNSHYLLRIFFLLTPSCSRHTFIAINNVRKVERNACAFLINCVKVALHFNANTRFFSKQQSLRLLFKTDFRVL